MRGAASFEERMLRDLMKRKRAYEAYFRAVERKGKPQVSNLKSSVPGKGGGDGGDEEEGLVVKPPDNSAHSAYVSIIKALVDIAKKAPSQGRSPEEMKRIAEEILERDYGIKH